MSDLCSRAVASEDATLQASWIAIAALAVGAFALVTSEFLLTGLLQPIARSCHSSDLSSNVSRGGREKYYRAF